ncbi:hypothetical protein KC850_01385 [Candidatus Kaiserbacteria bacterium]|nr:hypothetical protein [Candidatus Kaiserbacteria bacterium]MCB9818417.1 hypothetical protein [Candidatus Nomurabacteria bacterium]
MEIKKTTDNPENGFALLITLIVVGVVLSVGMTILDLSIKQVKLSTNARESEVSFHAANAGAECARYWRRYKSDPDKADDMVRGIDISPTCFGEVPETSNPITKTNIIPDDPSSGEVFQYQYEFEWGGSTRCTEINTIVASSTLGAGGITISNMRSYVPGFPTTPTIPLGEATCDEGSQCTILAVSGYNRPCSSKSGYGSVQREVLLQF